MRRFIFTICNVAYLPLALECERSFGKFHGAEWSFLIFLVDHPRLDHDDIEKLRGLLSKPSSAIHALSELFKESREISMMSLYYDITEYSTAVKPWIFDYLFKTDSPRSATYIDPDIMFFRSFGLSDLAMDGEDCVVTPHVLSDSLNSAQHPTLQTIRSCGSYNFGFVHFENTPSSRAVVRFWKRELIHDALVSLEDNLFTDQRFGDLFPSLCDVRVNRNPAVNVAYWNLQERLVREVSDDYVVQLIVNDEIEQKVHPLVFFHFSGLKTSGTIGISKYGYDNPRSPRGAHKTVESLVADYQRAAARHRARLQEISITTSPDLIGALSYVHDDQQTTYRLTPFERRSLNRLMRGRAASGGLSLPPSRFVDERRFLLSLSGCGLRHHDGISREEFNVLDVLRIHPPGLQVPTDDQDTHQAGFGGLNLAQINIVGYPNFSFGVGQITALILEGLHCSGVGFSFTVDPAGAIPFLESDLRWISSLATLAAFNPDAPTLFLVNADQMLEYVNSGVAHHCFSKVSNIGYWWWELETPVAAHAKASEYLDHVLAPTRFIEASLAKVVPSERLRYAPLDFQQLYESLVHSRSTVSATDASDQDFIWGMGLDLNLAKFSTVSLMIFDFASCIQRKNPQLLIDLFSSENLSGHALILKSSGGDSRPDQYAALIESIKVLPNVFLVNRRLSQKQLDRLYGIADIYLSPHRSEGLGLNLIEADSWGLSTVFTDYGGITDYPFYGTGKQVKCGYVPVEVTASSEIYWPYVSRLNQPVHWVEPNRSDFEAGLRSCIDHVLASRQGSLSSAALSLVSVESLQPQQPAITEVLVELIALARDGRARYRPTRRVVLRPSRGASLSRRETAREVALVCQRQFYGLKSMASDLRYLVSLLLLRPTLLLDVLVAIRVAFFKLNRALSRGR